MRGCIIPGKSVKFTTYKSAGLEWRNNMGLSKKPVTGMKDILPEEMKLRDWRD